MRSGSLLFAALAMAQTPPPQFDVATIKPAAPQLEGHTHVQESSDTRTGHLDYTNVSLKDVIAQAYRVQKYQVSGPDWIDTQRFDIVARFQPGTGRDQLRLMLQALLADRFKLAIHRETKDLPVYDLVVAKGGPKFKAIESESGITSDTNRTHWHVVSKGSMASFAQFLTDEAHRPVLDKTALPGSYELTLDWSADDAAVPSDGSPGPSLFTALQEQLGLKLESAKAPVESIVVDHAERAPTEN